jgi:hypothetical protein
MFSFSNSYFFWQKNRVLFSGIIILGLMFLCPGNPASDHNVKSLVGFHSNRVVPQNNIQGLITNDAILTKQREDWAIGKALNHIQQTPDGIELKHPQYKALFTSNGVSFTPVSGAPVWQWSNTSANKVMPHYLDNKVVYYHGNIREEYVIKNNSIEQQFVIERPVASNETLRVEGVIQSNGSLQKKENGWSWKNDKGEVTLSDVFVYDVNKKPIPANMEVTSTSSTIEIAPEFLKDAVYPVTIDPEIGTNDFRISFMGPDTDLSYEASLPTAAYNAISNTYLVVWQGTTAGEIEIWGQLLNGTTGAAIGTEIRISDMGTDGDLNIDAQEPHVAASTLASEFLVVWYGDDDTGALVDNEYEIYGQRLNAATGAALGTNDFRISDMGATDGLITFSAYSPRVTFNATQNEYLVVWYGDDDTVPLIDEEYEIFAQRLTSTGAQTGTNDIRVSDMGPDGNTSYFGLNPDVAWGSVDNQYIVTWYGDESIPPLVDEENEIFIQRLDGITGGPNGINDIRISDMGVNGVTTARGTDPAIAYNSINNNYLIVWRGDDATSPLVDNEFEVFGQIVSNIGAEVGSDFRISDMGTDGTTTHNALFPNVSHDPFNNHFLVCWYGDDNTVPLLDNEFEVYIQMLTGSGAAVGTNDLRISDAGGTGQLIHNAFFPHGVYNSTNREFLLVWRGDDNTTTTVDNEFEIWGQRFAELATDPTAQPTAPVFSSVTTTSMTVSFTAATGAPDGYIALRRGGASPTDIPMDGTAYTVGATIGSSTVAYVGSAVTFNETALTAGTAYHYDIFSFNGAAASINYRTASPLEGNRSTLAAEPANQPTLPVFSSVTPTSMTVSFTAAIGAPSGYLALRRTGASPVDVPVDGTTYAVGNTIGSSIVAFVGSALSFNETSLTALTNYHYDVFSFNGSGNTINYLASSPLEGNRSTVATEPVDQPTGLIFSSVDAESLTVSFTAASGPPTGYIVIRKKDSAPTGVPVDGTGYSVGDIIGDAVVVFTGATTTFNDAGLGLEGEKTFFYQVFAANFDGVNSSTANYRTTSPLSGSQLMLAYEPGSQATNLQFTNITPAGFTVSFTAADGFPTGYMAIRKAASSPTSPPVDATIYTVGQAIGDGTVAYFGTGTTFNETLVSDNYFYDVYTYNGGTGSINYRTLSPLEGSLAPDNTAPVVTDETPSTVTGTQDVKITAQIRESESSIQSVLVEYKSVSSPGSNIIQSMTLVAGKWEFSIPSASVGELGIEYKITATNTQGLSSSVSGNVLIALGSQTIPFNSFGSSVSNYRIISVPLNLTAKSVGNVLADDLEPDGQAPYDKSEWRIFRYETGSTVELGQSSPIELGKGYWLIVKNNKAIGTGPGQTADATSSDPFKIVLTNGWNQIGNPYPFDVSWSDVLSASGNPTSVTKFKTYEGSWNESSSVLNSFQGGFVFSNGATTLTFPTAKNSSINRIASRQAKSDQLRNSIDEPDWEINLTIQNGDQVKEGGGIGMRALANEGFDQYDDFTLPRFLNHVELNHAKTLFKSHYTKDIVPTRENYIWDFTVDTALPGATGITWDNEYFRNSANAIFLLDVERETLVDMKEKSTYAFNATGNSSTQFKVVFGSIEFVKENSLAKRLLINSVFPNPSAGAITVGFTTHKYDGKEIVRATLNSTMGVRPVATLLYQSLQAGYHEFAWEGIDSNELRPSPGVYLLEIRVGNQVRTQKVILK